MQPGQPKPAAVYVPPDQLRPWEKNPRRNDATVPAVMESIRRFGFAAPIIALPSGEIIAGHTRWKAALKLGLREVPVRYLDLTNEQAHLLNLADNKIPEASEWDYGLLAAAVQESFAGLDAALLKGFSGPDELLKNLGFSAAELDRLTAAESGGFLDEFRQPAATKPTPPPAEPADGFVTFAVKLEQAGKDSFGRGWVPDPRA
jgi:ParB-like chromosome segregation protein Spo0J